MPRMPSEYQNESLPDPVRQRILMIGPLPPPVGGMASVVGNLSRSLQRDCDVRVLSNTKTTPIDRTLLQGVQAQMKLLSRLGGTVIRWRPRILHIHTSSYNTFWRTSVDALLGKLLGRKVVLHIHGAQFHEFLGGLGPFRAAVARMVFAAADRTLVLGEIWKQRFAPWCSERKMRVVPNGVPVGTPPSAGKAFLGRVLCVANYERRKGLEDLLRAVAAVGSDVPVSLTVVGAEMDAGHRSHLQQVARELGVSDRVTLAGPVTAEEVGELYARADVFCLPSYHEGLPMSLLEAMAASLPVVATPVGAVPQLVREGVEGYLFDAGDVGRLESLLRRVLADPALARALGDRGRQRIAEEFSLEAVSLELFRVYEELSGRTR